MRPLLLLLMLLASGCTVTRVLEPAYCEKRTDHYADGVRVWSRWEGCTDPYYEGLVVYYNPDGSVRR